MKETIQTTIWVTISLVMLLLFIYLNCKLAYTIWSGITNLF